MMTLYVCLSIRLSVSRITRERIEIIEIGLGHYRFDAKGKSYQFLGLI